MASLQSGPAFVDFLRQHRTQILEQWERKVRRLPPAERLDRQALFDHLPIVLDDLADAAQAALQGAPAPDLRSDPDRHAITRLDQGYELGEVVIEYSLLRETILELSSSIDAVYPMELRVFNAVLDHALGEAVKRYSSATHRLLDAVNRMSTLAFGGEQPEKDLLQALLKIMVETAPAVDEATILLRHGDRLTVRAAIGITAERDGRFSIAVGEGFAGTIAARQEPLLIRNAQIDPLVTSHVLREHPIKALYGVPLMSGANLIGVAHMGSCTAYELLDEDLLLFRAMANRAAQILVEARLKSELREQQDQLRAQHDELQTVLRAAEVGTFTLDLKTSELRCDRRLREMFGLSSDEPISYERLIGLVAPADREGLEAAARQAIESRGEFRVRYRIVRPDGHERYVASRGAVLDGNRDTRLLGIVQDRTDDAYAERERELFLAALGHDLRSPLQAMAMGVGTILRISGVPEQATRIAHRVARSGERMSRLIDQLLDFARARAGQPMAITRRRTDLAELWHHVIDEIALGEPDRRIVLRAEAPTMGEWDPDRMLQVFQNLAANAVTYGDPTRPITITFSGDGEQVTCAVHNEGSPIPPETLPVIFNAFRRGRHGGAGLGLGLSIARQDRARARRAHRGRLLGRSRHHLPRRPAAPPARRGRYRMTPVSSPSFSF